MNNDNQLLDSVHELDFKIFSRFDGLAGQFLDIGANSGQSAVSFFNVNDSMHVLSLEPNPDLSIKLSSVRNLYPERFNFLIAGAADVNRTSLLLVPEATGVDLTVNSSLVPGEFKKEYVHRRILSSVNSVGANAYVLREINVNLVTIDSLGLDPSIIKIDVEGYERSVLQGALKTIRSNFPLLLIENNNMQLFSPVLTELGYFPFSYIHSLDRLVPLTWKCWEWPLNSIWLHPNMNPNFARRLPPLIFAGESFASQQFQVN